MMLQRHDVPMVGTMLIISINQTTASITGIAHSSVLLERLWYQNKAGTVTKKSFSLKFTWFFSVSIDSFSNLFQHCWASCRASRHPSNVKISMLHHPPCYWCFFPRRRIIILGNHPNKGKTPLFREGKFTPPPIEVLCVFRLAQQSKENLAAPIFTAAFHRPATHRRCGRNLRGPRNASQGDQRGDMFWMSWSPAIEENPKSSRMEGFLFESLIKFGCSEHEKGGCFFCSLMWNTVRFNLILLRSPV